MDHVYVAHINMCDYISHEGFFESSEVVGVAVSFEAAMSLVKKSQKEFEEKSPNEVIKYKDSRIVRDNEVWAQETDTEFYTHEWIITKEPLLKE